MDADALQHHLSDASRRGPRPTGPSGAAGGAACGDLVRISLGLDDGLIAGAASTPRAAPRRAPPRRRSPSGRGPELLDAARIGPEEIDDELGGLSPQGRHAAELAADALHRALRGASRSARSSPRAPGVGERVLVAMSGGVDSAVAALLERERGADVVAVTLKLWADRRTDGARSCCSPRRWSAPRRRPLARAPAPDHGPRAALPRGGGRAFLAGYAAGRTPNPCVRCNGEVRIDAMIELADRLGAGGSQRATMPASPTTATARCSRAPPTPPRTRPTCSRRCARRRWRGCASRSPS